MRLAPENRPRLQPRATKDLRLLRLLYGQPSTFAEDPEQAPDYPLRDAKPANDGNLYPYNSKLRPPPLWIDEDGVEIADQPKVVYSDPHYWPYTAQGHHLATQCRRLCRHNRRPIRRPGRTLLANEPLASSLKTTRALQPLARCPHQRDRTGFVEIRRRSDRAARPRRDCVAEMMADWIPIGSTRWPVAQALGAACWCLFVGDSVGRTPVATKT